MVQFVGGRSLVVTLTSIAQAYIIKEVFKHTLAQSNNRITLRSGSYKTYFFCVMWPFYIDGYVCPLSEMINVNTAINTILIYICKSLLVFSCQGLFCGIYATFTF